MNETTYVTGVGEMVDLIAYNYYGDVQGAAEAVLAANPGLAALGPVLPLNTILILPTLTPSPAPQIATIQLFA
ncbi:tail protein X [Rhodoblastus sp.]|uniref:tail protein X n=1 Tax=Rhodoblastus sp. TaxID=1962975 RepID=UPI003F97D4E3